MTRPLHVRDLPPGARFDASGRIVQPHRRRRSTGIPASIKVEPTSNGVRITGLSMRSLANWRAHWAERARHVAAVRRTLALALHGCTRPTLPCVVTITRYGARPLDGDNAVASAKPVRDEIARWLGIDDADPSVTWCVEQGIGPYAVTIAWEPDYDAILP